MTRTSNCTRKARPHYIHDSVLSATRRTQRKILASLRGIFGLAVRRGRAATKLTAETLFLCGLCVSAVNKSVAANSGLHKLVKLTGRSRKAGPTCSNCLTLTEHAETVVFP